MRIRSISDAAINDVASQFYKNNLFSRKTNLLNIDTYYHTTLAFTQAVRDFTALTRGLPIPPSRVGGSLAFMSSVCFRKANEL